MSHLFKQFRRDTTGLIWLSMGIFISLSLYSYSPTDPSFNSLGSEAQVQNFCGLIGAFLSDILFQSFGLAAWLWVVALFRITYEAFFLSEKEVFNLRFTWSLYIVFIASCLTSLYLPSEGGTIGLVVTTSLLKIFNFLGTSIVLWTVTGLLLSFCTKKSILENFSIGLGFVKKTLLLVKNIRFKFFSNIFISLFKFIFMRIQFVVLSLRKMLLSFKKALFFKKSTPIAVNDTDLPKENKEFQLFPLKKRKSYQKDFLFFEDGCANQAGEEPHGLEEKELEEGFGKSFIETDKESSDEESFLIENHVTIREKKNPPKVVKNNKGQWKFPHLSLLADPPLTRVKADEEEVKKKAELLVNKLEQFSVRGEIVGVKVGPAVTLFEFKPNVDVKVSKITELADDLSLALSSESIRIMAPIPGRGVVGIESANTSRETVFLKDLLSEKEFWSKDLKLPLVLGRQTNGKPHIADLRKIPHLMVAGSTGSGKSVFTVSVLVSLIFRHSPDTLRLILIDPKQVDLASFNDLPHLIMPPVTDCKKAFKAFKWAIREMEKRYRSLSKFGVRDIEAFNEKVSKLKKEEGLHHEQMNLEMGPQAGLRSYYFTPQPYIVIAVEEFGDLMAVDKANVEQVVVRLAQMARASGIHLILAMQSPRKDVVTGLIKTNIPGRVSFKVASKMDSRIILDESGAERLLSRGDMLYLAPGVSKPTRHLGPWLSDEEISKVNNFWKNQSGPNYDEQALRSVEGSQSSLNGGDNSFDEALDFDERYDEILAYVSTVKEVSASLIQRKFRLGYPRAARIIEVFESEGVVGPTRGSKAREVLVNDLK